MDAKTNSWCATHKKNVRHLLYWSVAWLIALALTAFGPEFLWDYNTFVSTVFVLFSVGIGLGMIAMNRKYVNGLDELHRKITMDAMAIALGFGVVFGLAYSSLDLANVILFDAEIAHLVMLIGLTYLIGIVVGHIRYT